MDIVERLRMTPETGADPDLIFEAIEEIDRLRANVLAEREACAALAEACDDADSAARFIRARSNAELCGGTSATNAVLNGEL